MKIFRKIKQHWKWITGYTVMFVTPEGGHVKYFIVHHRIGRAPIMRTEQRREALRGTHSSIIIFDETQYLSDAQLEEIKSKAIPGVKHDTARRN